MNGSGTQGNYSCIPLWCRLDPKWSNKLLSSIWPNKFQDTTTINISPYGGEAFLLLNKSADISMIVCWTSATWPLDVVVGITLLKDWESAIDTTCLAVAHIYKTEGGQTRCQALSALYTLNNNKNKGDIHTHLLPVLYPSTADTIAELFPLVWMIALAPGGSPLELIPLLAQAQLSRVAGPSWTETLKICCKIPAVTFALIVTVWTLCLFIAALYWYLSRQSAAESLIW